MGQEILDLQEKADKDLTDKEEKETPRQFSSIYDNADLSKNRNCISQIEILKQKDGFFFKGMKQQQDQIEENECLFSEDDEGLDDMLLDNNA